MRSRSVIQVRAIQGHTPQETAMLFNQAMQELAALHPTYERDGGTFWITYTVVQDEAETLAERYQLMGDTSICADCPKIVRDLNRFGEIDARRKWALCASTGERVRVEARACDTYYRILELEKGESKSEEQTN